jgi:hypothetical protein
MARQHRMQAVNDWLSTIVSGRSFADVGGLWGTLNEKVTVAAQAGARAVTMIDITPLEDVLWRRLEERCSETGVAEYTCIEADITLDDAKGLIPEFDVIHCSGVLYHCSNPRHALAALVRMSNDFVIIGTSVIPEDLLNNTPSFSESGSYYVPQLDPLSKQMIHRYFRDVGAEEMIGITSQVDWDPRDCAPWWWLHTPRYVAGLLCDAGLRILDTASEWEGRTALFLCERTNRMAGARGAAS